MSGESVEAAREAQVESIGRPRSRARWAIAGAAAVLVAVVAVIALGMAGPSERTAGIGRAAPDLRLPLLEAEGDESLTSEQDEVVVVNFWASWCVPCRQEHSVLTEGARAFERAGVRFVGVVFQDDTGNAVRFLDQFGRGYPVVVDPESRAAVEFGVFGIPETFFIAGDGTIAARVFGALDPATLQDNVERVLAMETPGQQQGGEHQRPPGS